MTLPPSLGRIARCTWLVALLTLGVPGCVNQKVVGPPPIQQAPPFSPSGRVGVPDHWWRAFDDPELDRQIDRALAQNLTLAGVWQQLRAARALVGREASALFPAVNAVADASGTLNTDGPNDSLFELGLAASYEVDLWGRIQSHVEAESLRASAILADYQTTGLTLSAEIARIWFALVEAHAQLALVHEQIETNRTGLELIEERFGVGQGFAADVLRQRQLVEATREQAIVIRLRIETLEHALAVFQGLPPQQLSYQTGIRLPELPPLPATGLPAELLQRRPDVRRDYLEVLAADRDLASAISAQYPRIDLAASVTTAAESPENLFREWMASIAGQLIAPLFDAGQRRAEVARTAAVLDQRFFVYGQTVLVAFQEVEDALAQERYQFERLVNLLAQLELAQEASTQLRDQYQIQLIEYISVLSATIEEQRLQREILSARLDLIFSRIALYRALAGGFAIPPGTHSGGHDPENIGHERPPEETLDMAMAADR